VTTPFQFVEWPCPAADGETRSEAALVFNRARDTRLLVIPPLFEEANKLRRQIVEIMRRLDDAGIDSVLPDLPGCNESRALLAQQTLEGWRAGAAAAAEHFGATHVLSVRGGALLRPAGLPGWDYAPQDGPKILRAMVRARIISTKEASAPETREEIEATGRSEGVQLAGWSIGPALFAALESAEVPARGDGVSLIDHETLGGRPLWLRAEPDFDAAQADALAATISVAMRDVG
jgi:hypothetical protein